MKANQNFRRDDEAVSPVIGVILMVAITVVLAAVVFVLVNNLGEGAESAPNITFNRSEANDRLTVVTAPSPAIGWNQFTISAQHSSPGGVFVALNIEADAADDPLPHSTGFQTGTAPNEVEVNVGAGHYLNFCYEPDGAELTSGEVTITVAHDASGTLVGSFTFATIGLC